MKNKFTLIALLLCTILVVSASDSTSTRVKPYNRIYIGPSFTLNSSYRILQENASFTSTVADPNPSVHSRNKYEVPELGAVAGLKLGVNITRWLAVESGLQYSWIRYRYKSLDYTIYPNDPDPHQTYYRNTYHYLDVPIAVNFVAGKKRVRGVFSFGAALDFLVKYQHDYDYTYVDGHHASANETSNFYALKKFDISPFIGIGMDIYVTKGIDLRIMPIGQIQALKNPNAPVSEYLWNAGVNVSLLFGVLKIRQ